MSDSSEDEDLSRFREVIDTSFMQLIQCGKNQSTKDITSKLQWNSMFKPI